jgi:hypothetical protein
LSLKKLLIEIGGIDFGEQVTGFDSAADIDFTARYVTADPGKKLGLGIGIETAGQIEQTHARLNGRHRDRDHRHSALRRLVAKLRFTLLPAFYACEGHDDRRGDEQDRRQRHLPARSGRPLFDRRFRRHDILQKLQHWAKPRFCAYASG